MEENDFVSQVKKPLRGRWADKACATKNQDAHATSLGLVGPHTPTSDLALGCPNPSGERGVLKRPRSHERA